MFLTQEAESYKISYGMYFNPTNKPRKTYLCFEIERSI